MTLDQWLKIGGKISIIFKAELQGLKKNKKILLEQSFLRCTAPKAYGDLCNTGRTLDNFQSISTTTELPKIADIILNGRNKSLYHPPP